MALLVDLFFYFALCFLIIYLLIELCYAIASQDDHIKQKKNHSCKKKGLNSDGACSVRKKSSKRIKEIVTFESGEVCGKEESTGSVLESNETNGNGGVCEESSNILEKLEAFDTREGGFEIGGDDVGKEESTVLVLESNDSNGKGGVCDESSNFLEKFEASPSELGSDDVGKEESTGLVLESNDSNGNGRVCEESSNFLESLEAFDTREGGFEIGCDEVGKEESTGLVLESNDSNGNGRVCEENSKFLGKLEAFDTRESGLEMGGGDVMKEESTGLVLESNETNGNGSVCEESSNILEKLEAFDTREGCFEIGGGDIGKEESFFEEELGEDWEGIQRSEMERVFGKAVAFVGSKDNADKVYGLGSKVNLRLYGLHKIAIEGPCVKAPPSAFKVSARAKWNAWKQLGNISQEDAMEQYIILVSECCPEWIKDHNMEDGKQASAHRDESSKLPSNLNTSPSSHLASVDERTSDGEDSSSNWVEPKAFIAASN